VSQLPLHIFCSAAVALQAISRLCIPSCLHTAAWLEDDRSVMPTSTQAVSCSQITPCKLLVTGEALWQGVYHNVLSER
jgi:hypothetical protein